MDKSSFNNERQLESRDIIWQLRSPPSQQLVHVFHSSHPLDLPTRPFHALSPLQCLLWESIVYSVSIKGSGNIKSFPRQTMGRHKLAPPACCGAWLACLCTPNHKQIQLRVQCGEISRLAIWPSIMDQFGAGTGGDQRQKIRCSFCVFPYPSSFNAFGSPWP